MKVVVTVVVSFADLAPKLVAIAMFLDKWKKMKKSQIDHLHPYDLQGGPKISC